MTPSAEEAAREWCPCCELHGCICGCLAERDYYRAIGKILADPAKWWRENNPDAIRALAAERGQK